MRGRFFGICIQASLQSGFSLPKLMSMNCCAELPLAVRSCVVAVARQFPGLGCV